MRNGKRENKREREKEGERGTKKENNETVKKNNSMGKERERFEQKNAEIGKWKPKKKTGQSVSERGGKRNVHQHERRNKNNL